MRVPCFDGKSHDEYDVAFHEAIFTASHNLVWAQISHVLKPAIALLVERSNHSADRLNDSMDRHRRVMEAIRLRQPQEAARAALAVLERTGQDLGLEGVTRSPATIETTFDAPEFPATRQQEG